MLDRATIERAQSLSAGAPLLVALSGGGDSTALVHFLAEALPPALLRVATVDHALRDGSAADARRAAGFAQALGLHVRVLTLAWPEGPKPAQGAARQARYAALCEEARRCGARAIVLAHTLDDQAETVLMRAARGSSWRGLAGMRALSPAPLWPQGRELVVARPLLGVRRAALRAALSARNGEWIEDPANENRDFARVRVRQRLARLAAAGLAPERLAALAGRLAEHTAALDRAAWALICAAVRFDGETIEIARRAWAGEDAVRARALSVLIAAASGAAREPAGEQVAALVQRLDEAEFKAATLGGAVLRRAGQRLLLRRDPGALTGRADGPPARAAAPLPADEEVVWDGRVALKAAEPGWWVEARGAAIPELVCGPARAPLAAARPRWLLEAHARHRLALD